jgi:hypothetical protein
VTTRDQVKAALDKAADEYFSTVRRMIESLERRAVPEGESGESWADFLASVYSSIADAPIERGKQGEFEVRDPVR